jgi:hypothetical protein
MVRMVERMVVSNESSEKDTMRGTRTRCSEREEKGGQVAVNEPSLAKVQLLVVAWRFAFSPPFKSTYHTHRIQLAIIVAAGILIGIVQLPAVSVTLRAVLTM